jgi:hypothetical protein
MADVMKGHGPCTYLLLALLGLILLSPYLQGGLHSRVILAILNTAVMLGGAYAMGQNRRLFILGIVLAMIGVVLQWLMLLATSAVLLRLGALSFAAFLALMIGEVLRYILKRGPVTADKLHGALAGYIMIAFLWALLYALTESISPGSFVSEQVRHGEPNTFFRLLYFSFTTLTTTGYGDITPVTDQARSLVMIEEFAGVFFVGVLIARLAGLYPQEPKGRGEPPPSHPL